MSGCQVAWWMDRWMGGWKIEQADGWGKCNWIYCSTGGQMDGWLDRWVRVQVAGGWMDGWMIDWWVDGETSAWIDGWAMKVDGGTRDRQVPKKPSHWTILGNLININNSLWHLLAFVSIMGSLFTNISLFFSAFGDNSICLLSNFFFFKFYFKLSWSIDFLTCIFLAFPHYVIATTHLLFHRIVFLCCRQLQADVT